MSHDGVTVTTVSVRGRGNGVEAIAVRTVGIVAVVERRAVGVIASRRLPIKGGATVSAEAAVLAGIILIVDLMETVSRKTVDK